MKFKINKRFLIKTGTGAAAGFMTGGWYGAAAGGIAAGTTGGKAKPLKSALIGASTGYVAGYAAQSFGLRGSGNVRFGSYTYKPLSARTFDYFNKPSSSPSVATKDSPSGSYRDTLTSIASQYPHSSMDSGGIASLLAGANNSQDGGVSYPTYDDTMGSNVPSTQVDGGGAQDGGWLPIIIMAGAAYLLGVA